MLFIPINGRDVLVLEPNASDEARRLSDAAFNRRLTLIILWFVAIVLIVAVFVFVPATGDTWTDLFKYGFLAAGVGTVVGTIGRVVLAGFNKSVETGKKILNGERRSDYVSEIHASYQLLLTEQVVAKMREDRQFAYATMSFLSENRICNWDWVIRTSGPGAGSTAMAFVDKHALLREGRRFLDHYDLVDEAHFNQAAEMLDAEFASWQSAVEEMRVAGGYAVHN